MGSGRAGALKTPEGNNSGKRAFGLVGYQQEICFHLALESGLIASRSASR